MHHTAISVVTVIIVSNSDCALQDSEHRAALQTKRLQLLSLPFRRTSCTVKNSLPKFIFAVSSFQNYIPPLIYLYLGDTNKNHQPYLSVVSIPFLPLLLRHGCQSFRDPRDSCDLLTILWGHSLVGGIFLKLTPWVTDSPENSAVLLGRGSLQYPWIATFCVKRVSCPNLIGAWRFVLC